MRKVTTVFVLFCLVFTGCLLRSKPSLGPGILVADFGDPSVWTEGTDNTPAVPTKSQDTGFFAEKGLKLSYHLPVKPDSGVHPRVFVRTRFTSGRDWTSADYLTFWAKLKPGSVGDSLSATIFDSTKNQTVRTKFNEIFKDGEPPSPDGWYKVVVPLEKYTNLNLADVREVRIYIEGIYTEGGTGEVILDALYLEKADSVLEVTTSVANEQLIVDIDSPHTFWSLPKVRIKDGSYLEVSELQSNRCRATYSLQGEDALTLEILVPGNPIHVVEWFRN